MRIRLLVLALPVIATIALASVAQGNPVATDMDRTKAAGWDCTPEVPIAGQYLHCSQPGKPSVADLLSADGVTVQSLELRVFNFADQAYAGTETLIRDDLHPEDRSAHRTRATSPVEHGGCSCCLPGTTTTHAIASNGRRPRTR